MPFILEANNGVSDEDDPHEKYQLNSLYVFFAFISVFAVFFILLISIYLPEVKCPSNEPIIRETYTDNFLHIYTDRPQYAIGQIVHIIGEIHNSTDKNLNISNVNVQVTRTHAPQAPWCYSK